MFCTLLCSLALPVLLILGIFLKRKYMSPPIRSPTHLKNTYGGWAVITGASSGIGTEFAKLLAGEGFNLVLVARRKQILDELAAQLKKQHGVDTQVVSADLSTVEGPYAVHEAVSKLDVGIFINNAGVGWFGFVREEDPKHIEQIVAVNVTSMAVLTRLFLESMGKRTSGKRSGIIITSSLASYFAGSCATTYSAAKSFASYFGVSVWREEKQRQNGKIDVSILEPGPVATEFGEVSGTLSNDPNKKASPTFVASRSLDYLAAQVPVCQPEDSNYWMSWASLFPRDLISAMVYKEFHSKHIKRPNV